MRTNYLKLVIPVVATGILSLIAVFSSGGSVYALESSPTPTPAPTASPTATPSTQTGSISVCNVIMDGRGNVVDGSQIAGVTFTVKGLPHMLNSGSGPGGVIPDSTFTTPLNLNTDVFGGDGKNDASCVRYDNLPMGDYFYSEETISSANGWKRPLYNDQYITSVRDKSFFPYDNGIFTSQGFSDNKNSDGQIVLQAGRPNRTLVVLNTLSAVASPTPTPSSSPSPTPVAGGTGSNNNNQSQSQTQNNNQTVNVTVDQSALGAKAPTKQPETGISVLGLVSAFSAAPFGLMLSRFGKGKSVFRRKEELGKFALETFSGRNRGLDNL